MSHCGRLALHERVKVILDDDCVVRIIIAEVVGTWSWSGASGMPGAVETRLEEIDTEPSTSTTAQGYVLRPTDGHQNIRVPWADVDLGYVRRMS